MDIPAIQPYLNWRDTTLYHEDFLVSKSVPDNSVDLIVTSPPYNLGIEYSTHDDTQSYEDYLAFSRAWLSHAYTLSRDTGRLCLNIPLDTNKGGVRSLYADLCGVARESGWKYHTTIVWNESNISKRTAWGSWMSASAPCVISPVEMIVVFYKGVWKKQTPGVSDITRDEFMAWTNGLWSFNGESMRIGHPAPFPCELPNRCIKLFSYVGDTVLDPFAGSGTTLLSAQNQGRHAIGFEIAERYCQIAATRLKTLF